MLTSSRKVLVVDDDAVSRLLIGQILQRQNLDVDIAPNGHEALEAAERCDYDMVVCDYNMPGLSGLDLVDYFAQKGIPFVLLTGLIDTEYKDDDRVVKISAELTKPVSSQDVADLIEQFLVPASS